VFVKDEASLSQSPRKPPLVVDGTSGYGASASEMNGINKEELMTCAIDALQAAEVLQGKIAAMPDHLREPFSKLCGIVEPSLP
jgi:hypothetical protein